MAEKKDFAYLLAEELQKEGFDVADLRDAETGEIRSLYTLRRAIAAAKEQ